jgi:cathepsin A (carboxypeptidase C)
MGESYAGHYIPSIANHLYFNPDERIKLAGLAIGNGWVDPFYQYPAYPIFAQS